MRVHRSRRVPATLLILLFSVAVSGCAIPRTWHYPPTPPGTLLNLKAAKAVPVKVAVQPLRDLRGENANESSWMVAIPLVPYGVDSFDRPENYETLEGAPLIRMTPSRDFARAIADELRNAGVFSSVTYEDGNAPAADLVLTGSVKTTGWRRAYTTYMLGPVGPLLWMLGAPIATTTNRVVIDLQLAPAGSAQTLWKFSIEFEDRHVIGAYYGSSESVENYSEAVQEATKLALEDLVKRATQTPEALQPPK